MPGRDEGPGMVHAGRDLPGSSSPSWEEKACLRLISISPALARCARQPRQQNSRRQRPGLAAYRTSVQDGQPISERKLRTCSCLITGVTSRGSWRWRMA